MATLRLFASARDAAGTARDDVAGATVAEVLDLACDRYGEGFVAVLASSRVWLNGEPADRAATVADGDEVAVLPPVSGGSGSWPDPGRDRPRPRATAPVAEER